MKFTVINSVPSIDKATGQQYKDNYGNLSWSLMATGDDSQTYSFLKRVKQGFPAPKPGDVLDGVCTTEMSKNGNSYTKFTATPKEQGTFSGGSKPVSDPNTMLIAYAKDLVVALISNQVSKEKLTTENVMSDLDVFTLHLKGLYESMKVDKPVQNTIPNTVPVQAPLVQTTVSARDDIPPMPADDEIDINSIPWKDFPADGDPR